MQQTKRHDDKDETETKKKSYMHDVVHKMFRTVKIPKAIKKEKEHTHTHTHTHTHKYTNTQQTSAGYGNTLEYTPS